MSESANILYTTPSGEHITARRSTRAKFLQLETSQLKAYITDLESSIGTNKHLLKDLANTIKVDFMLDKTFTTRMIKDLEAENLALEERIRRVTIEKNDAILKAHGSDKLVRDILTRERGGEHPLESEMRARRVTLEEKEGKVQNLDMRCKQLVEEIDEHDRQRELMASNDKESSLRLTEKYIRLKDISEKLQRELGKVQESKADLQENCKQLFGDLRKVNAVLKNPITRSERIEEFLNRSDSEEMRSEFPADDCEVGEDMIPSDFLLRQLEVLHDQQKIKSLTQKVSLAITDFSSQPEQRYSPPRLTAEGAKLTNKIKDMQLKAETLMDELKSTRRLNVSLQQDNYRLTAAFDSLQHKLRAYEDIPLSSIPKTVSVNPRLQHSICPHHTKQRKKGRASSNPLEYLDESQPRITAPLTTRGPRLPLDIGELEDSIDPVELSPEMPSMIKRVDGDEFLQGDSFLVDALRLRNK